jgi:hypothetical protein
MAYIRIIGCGRRAGARTLYIDSRCHANLTRRRLIAGAIGDTIAASGALGRRKEATEA